LHKSFLLFN